MKRWYLLYCKRGEQLRAKMHLENQGVECFYPEIEVEKIRRGKRQTVKEPLFPSYIFVRFDFNVGPSFTTVRSTRGVSDFIRFGSEPKELQGDLIYDLKQLESSSKSETPSVELPKPGQEIEVKGGQFCGLKAIYQEPDGETRSIMLVKMISQPVALSIDNKHLDFKK
ncbi:transcription/translation regulatory transformer protein RfaH [Vibrio fluvialis]|uniref:transcription/translation regulatory transformer protein RfaH n=1 Tax=Vibrio fluvialis TaxID=676 RepID=UPI0013023DB2|nr:transcription/translation regulatory transformer protein RfaH [Vibrio fluvialis]EKO3388818.1 transcription/translation regulatory transformer protein RfaH [Vibrio fluvialis]EKO3401172.1 transcription/translation regulatory transformer protein RfaH [Vibrio fluvialis]EKO3474661.1 transcription/translation regulatory transformer protein RfaH [Vibrio fluvialis]EKO3952848.1 transcription/translation regulatory transformer protein RfaH [Vibrio fluvialis]EKO3989087.1 transcription/translation regu